MRRRSLRLRLTLWTAALSGFAILCFGIGVSWHLRRDGLKDLDAGLKEVAQVFFDGLGKHPTEFPWTDRAAVQELFPNVRNVYFVEVSAADSRVLYRSKDLGDAVIPPSAEDRGFHTTKLLGHNFRIGVFRDHNITLRLAGSMYSVEEDSEDLLIAYLVALPIVLIVVGTGGWWVARKALAPVEQITEAAERITAQHLDQRLPDDGRRDEIGRLTAVLNRMIDRLESSFHQATRFTADASHELKTPLTIIRGELEEALRRGEVPPAQEKMCLTLLNETVRLSTITEGLLLLSRADAGKFLLELTPVNLSLMLAEIVEDVEILAGPRSVSIAADVPPDIFIRANGQFLRQLLLNLFDNAIKYNHQNGEIRVELRGDKNSHELSIANTSDPISPENAAHLFDRFYRGDATRENRQAGHGLGLSICREIVRVHHGTITLDVSQTGWTKFQITLPAERPPKVTASTAPVSAAISH